MSKIQKKYIFNNLYIFNNFSPSARVCICRYNTAAHVVNSTSKIINLCMSKIQKKYIFNDYLYTMIQNSVDLHKL